MRYVYNKGIVHKVRISALNIGASSALLLNSFAAAAPLFFSQKAFAVQPPSDTPSITEPSAATTVNTPSYTIQGTTANNSVNMTVTIYRDDGTTPGTLDGNDTVVLSKTGANQSFSYAVSLNSGANNFFVTATDGTKSESAAAVVPTITYSAVTPITPTVTPQDFTICIKSAISCGYDGMNVGFQLGDFASISAVTVTLSKGSSDIVSNTATQDLLDAYNVSNIQTLSSPFVVNAGSFDPGTDTYWTHGAHSWTSSEQPDEATITVTGADNVGATKTITAYNTTLTQGLATYASFFPAPDTTSPSVPQLVSPVDRGYTKTNDFYFKWTASTDDNPGVTYEFQSSQNPHTTNGVLDIGVWNNIADGAPDRNDLTDPQIHSYGAPDGVWYWQVRAIDAAGNTSTWTKVWHVTIDTHAPTTTLNVEHLANGYVNSRQNGDKLTITGSASDNLGLNRVLVQLLTSKHGAIENHTVYLVGTSQDWSTDYDIRSLGLADGKYSVVATVVDNAGNTYKTPYLDYTLDNTKPVATFTSSTSNPTPNGIYNKDFNVGYEVSDNYMLKSVGVSLFDTDASHSNHWATGCYSNGSETVSDDSGTCTVKLGSLPDGKYYVAVQGQDAAGLWTVAATRYITIDRTGPAVTITAPANGDLISAAHGYTVSGTVDDSDVSGVSRVVVYVKDLTDSTQSKTMQATVTGGTWSIDLDSSVLPDGHQARIIAYAKDGLNNTGATTHVDVTMDNTGPELTYNGKATNDNVITPDYTATDAHGSTPLTFAWAADAGNPAGATISDNTVLNPDFTVTSTGNYKFTLTASDSLGNATTSTFSFTYTQPSGGGNSGFTNTVGTTGQPAITAGTLALAATPQVLGDSTTAPTTPNDDSSNGKVQGDSTINLQNNNSDKTVHSSNFLGLGWWWLLILAVVITFLGYAFFRSSTDDGTRSAGH